MKLLLLLVFFSLLTGFEVTFGDENDGVLGYRRAENIPGAAPKPSVTSLKQTKDWALLQCEVRGVFPKPKLHWQDSDGNILHAEEPKESERGGRYDVILQTTVTKTDNYRCVATQEKIKHQIYSETYVFICEPDVIKMEGGSDAILPCSLSSKESIEFKLFVWKKDDQKEVFVYNMGNETTSEQFIGRVSHFKNELKSGNASIIIRNTKVADSGDYTCDFPQLQPRQIFYIKLHVDRTAENIPGSNVIKVIVEEGSDVILPCSLSSKESIVSKRFDWKKDGQKEVFLYDSGIHTNNDNPGQDEQFKGRVSHFEDELKSGNASIIIRNTKVADRGNYTCDFPHLQPKRQIFHIKLHVVAAAPEPYLTILKQTENWALLQCEVRGASPKPKLHWQNRAGNILHAEEPKVTERGGRYDVILQTTVTKTDDYRCVATQEEIKHHIYAEIYVFISGLPTGWIVAAVFVTLVLGIIVLAVLRRKGYITLHRNTGGGAADQRNQHENVQLDAPGDPHNQPEND